MSWKSSDGYTRYCALTERPQGLEAWKPNPKGEIAIGRGELWCRYDIADEEDEVKFCHKGKFSHNGNLRSHVKSAHKVELEAVRKGTSSGSEAIEADKFYTAIMKVHDSLSKNYDPAVGVEEPVVGVATPSRHLQKTKKAHRPHLPRKKDGSVNKAEARRVAAVGAKCPPCKENKRNCPYEGEGEDCEVWDAFTSSEE